MKICVSVEIFLVSKPLKDLTGRKGGSIKVLKPFIGSTYEQLLGKKDDPRGQGTNHDRVHSLSLSRVRGLGTN